MWVARQLRPPGRRDHLPPSFRRLLLTSLRLFSSSSGRTSAPRAPVQSASHFMVDYLVSSCGLSSAEALRASKPLLHLRSPEKPDAVLRLLRQEGLGDAHIRRTVVRSPRLLLADARRSLEPKIRALQGAGFAGPEIGLLLSSKPNFIYLRDLPHRMDFWRELTGSNQDLLQAVKRDSRLLSRSLQDKILPSLSLLRSLGILGRKQVRLMLTKSSLVSTKPGRLQALVEQVKALGLSPGSGIFLRALLCVSNLSRSTFDAKSKFLRSFGWTQAELTFAIQRFPYILLCSEKKIHAVMDFLLNEAGCQPSFIASHPVLVGLSMERRLMPRYHVLRSLKKEGLPFRGKHFHSAMKLTEHDFIHRYIAPYHDQLPHLLDAYHGVLAKEAKPDADSL